MKIDRSTFWYTFAGFLAGLIASAILIDMVDNTMRGGWDATPVLVGKVFGSIALIGLSWWLVTRPRRLETIEEDSEVVEVVQEAFDAFKTHSIFDKQRSSGRPTPDPDDELPPAA